MGFTSIPGAPDRASLGADELDDAGKTPASPPRCKDAEPATQRAGRSRERPLLNYLTFNFGRLIY